MGARDPVFGLPARGPAGDLHHQRDRGAEPSAAQGAQDQGPLPHRGRRPQVDLPRHHQRRPAMDAMPQLDDGAAGLQDPLRQSAARHRKLTVTPSSTRSNCYTYQQRAYTENRTPSIPRRGHVVLDATVNDMGAAMLTETFTSPGGPVGIDRAHSTISAPTA